RGRPAIDAAPERPQYIARDPEGGDPERDRDDEEEQDEADQAGHGVADGHPDAAQHQPDDVQNDPHDAGCPFPVSVLAAGKTNVTPTPSWPPGGRARRPR